MIKYATQNTVGVGVTRLPIFLFKFYVSWYSIKVEMNVYCNNKQNISSFTLFLRLKLVYTEQ